MQGSAASHSEAASPILDVARYQTFSRLVESLMHEVRNPLNALSIHLEVLSERLRSVAGGALPTNQEKHLTAIRSQVQRVDGTLRAFAEFLCAPDEASEAVDFSDTLQKAMEILGHETRRARVTFQAEVEPELRVRLRRRGLAPFFSLQPLLRAICRAPQGGVVVVRWGRWQDGQARLEVRDTGDSSEPFPSALQALEQASRIEALELSVDSGTFGLVLPLRA